MFFVFAVVFFPLNSALFFSSIFHFSPFKRVSRVYGRRECDSPKRSLNRAIKDSSYREAKKEERNNKKKANRIIHEIYILL